MRLSQRVGLKPRAGTRLLVLLLVAAPAAVWPGLTLGATTVASAPPAPETVQIRHLTLPPTAPSSKAGSWTIEINPHHTGCMDADWDAIESGGFTPDGHNVTATVQFTNAPAAATAPGDTHTGLQLVLLRTDGTTFPGGNAWKCLTRGVPAADKEGATLTDFGYPHPFKDGQRVLAAARSLSCGDLPPADDRCTPANTHMCPIHWTTTVDGSGHGGSPRELRLRPDQAHIGISAFDFSGGRLSKFACPARVTFNADPTTRTPAAPPYDLTKVTRLFNSRADPSPVRVGPDNPGELVVNPAVRSVGELRGFTPGGTEALYVGYPTESSNIDVHASDLTTRNVRRLTSHPEYVDPVESSPDDKWIVALDTRGSDRQIYLSAMRGVPPVTNLATAAATRAGSPTPATPPPEASPTPTGTPEPTPGGRRTAPPPTTSCRSSPRRAAVATRRRAPPPPSPADGTGDCSPRCPTASRSKPRPSPRSATPCRGAPPAHQVSLPQAEPAARRHVHAARHEAGFGRRHHRAQRRGHRTADHRRHLLQLQR